MQRRHFLSGLPLALGLLPLSALAGERPSLDLPCGARLHRFTVGDDVDFTVVRFDASRCTLRVIDQPGKAGATTLAQAMPRTGALAGVNGGFFTPAFEPLGLTIAQGQRRGSWQRSSLLGGVVLVNKGRLQLLWRDEFQDSANLTELLQAGPRLVARGQPIKGLETRSRRPRTFIATDNAGQWLLGTAGHTTLAELAQWLATPGLVPGIRIDRALNFDGGKSTGFWARTSNGQVISEPEISRVRNFVAIVPRSRP